jgi:hypothetical protein
MRKSRKYKTIYAKLKRSCNFIKKVLNSGVRDLTITFSMEKLKNISD